VAEPVDTEEQASAQAPTESDATSRATEAAAAAGFGKLASRGAAWMFGLNISNRVLGLVRTAIIARLLAPDDLGLFGIALLAQSIIEIFSMFGLTSALVRHPDDIDKYLDTAWVISFLRGVAVAVIMVLAAPLFAMFFDQPGATDLIRILAITSALSGFFNPAVVKLRRHLEFGRMFAISIAPGLLDVAVSIAIAYVYRTPMALILGMVVKTAAILVIGYFAVPYLPRVRYDKARARELMSYGKWITGSTIVRFLYSQGDDIVVGRLLGAGSLGIYQIGYRYSNLPTTEITRVLQVVALPVYAKVQGDPVRLRKAFLEALGTTSLASMAFAGYIWIITPDFVQLVLGSKWLGVVTVMRLLAIWGAAESVSEIPIALFEAVGKPQLATRRLLAKAVVLGALIYPFLTWWGLQGVCIAVLISSVPALVWSLFDGARTAGTGAREVLSRLVVPVIGAGLAMGGAMALGLVLPVGSVFSLLGLTGLCFALYAVVALVARACGYTAASQLWSRLSSSLSRHG
jgi:lipopolysaccharide exporter